MLKLTSFSPNIKERMDASCAIFDAKAQLVAQAEHVPIHLGSMLKAVGPDHRRGRDSWTPATSSSSTIRSSAARTCPTSRWSRPVHAGEHADRLCRDPRASFRRRRHGAGLDARQVERDLPGGPRHPAGAALPARRAAGRRAAPDPGQRAHRHRAPRRPQRAAGGDPHRRAAPRRAGRALWRARAGRGLRRDPRLCRAAHAQPHRRAAAGHLSRARTASTTTAAATSRCWSSCAWRCRATSCRSISRAPRRSGAATSTPSRR